MLKNIPIICVVIFCIATTAIGKRETQIVTSVLDVIPDNIKIEPFVKVGNKLYHFGESQVNWFKASLICRSMGGFLASFETKEELDELSSYMAAKYPTDRSWWISASDLQGEGNFYWYRTGERITYADWSGNGPDNAGTGEDCVHLWYKTSKYQMNDWMCTQNAYYVCEADNPKTVVVSIF